jgi:hypothetical protein
MTPYNEASVGFTHQAIVTGLTPTAQWWGVAIKKVPSASAWATADSHSARCSSVRLPRILCFISRYSVNDVRGRRDMDKAVLDYCGLRV